VRVVARAVGGGFGAKSGLYIEYVIAGALAQRLQRPVKWAESRSENMVAMTHGRGRSSTSSSGSHATVGSSRCAPASCAKAAPIRSPVRSCRSSRA